MDTPETVHPTKAVERFGREASAFLKKLIEGKDVRAAYDGPAPTYDKHRRLLVYLYLGGTPTLFVNREIVARGYGHAYVQFPFAFMEDFRAAGRKAREANLGLWAPANKAPDAKAGTATPETTTATKPVRRKKTYRQSSQLPGSSGSGFTDFGGSDGVSLPGVRGGTLNAGLCGASTKSGAPCQRLVAGGGFCYQHR